MTDEVFLSLSLADNLQWSDLCQCAEVRWIKKVEWIFCFKFWVGLIDLERKLRRRERIINAGRSCAQLEKNRYILECIWQVLSHAWCILLAPLSWISVSVSHLQIPINVLKTLRDSGSGGSTASREEGGGFINAQSAKRSGWKRWWWPTLKWWSITGAKLWKAMFSLSWILWVWDNYGNINVTCPCIDPAVALQAFIKTYQCLQMNDKHLKSPNIYLKNYGMMNIFPDVLNDTAVWYQILFQFLCQHTQRRD